MWSLSGGFIVNSRSNICMSGPMRCFKSLRFEKTCFHHQKAQMEESVSEPVGVRGTYKRPVKWEKKDLLLWQMLQHSWSETRMGLCKVTATVTYGLLPIRQKTSSHPLLPSLCMFWVTSCVLQASAGARDALQLLSDVHFLYRSASTSGLDLTQQLQFGSNRTHQHHTSRLRWNSDGARWRRLTKEEKWLTDFGYKVVNQNVW